MRALSAELGREHAPLEFGLRITTFVRDTTEQAWADAEIRVAEMAANSDGAPQDPRRPTAVGQQRLLELAARVPPGWSVPPRTSPSRCVSIGIWGSPTSCCRIRRTCARSNARVTSYCRCSGNERTRRRGR
ncbi:hypothetical protein [Nocardia sp. NPDC050718]|uniref:hypothetical protein n=1 Tax=Nocardia sp. NPDC050718 TaxID=3155788 RepID=UPI0033ECCBAB